MPRTLVVVACALAFAASSVGSEAGCDARPATIGESGIRWHTGPVEDRERLDEWCRAVGPPLLLPVADRTPTPAPPAALEDVVVITWNSHLGDGRLSDLIDDLRAGTLTSGHGVTHFVLLLQELYRRGADVPPFGPNMRSAIAITARNRGGPDAHAYGALGFALYYVPSMRNGAEFLEDRGSAILSTEPLVDVLAVELPFERQRRVAAGASIPVRTGRGIEALRLMNVHLEPMSAPSALWLFRNPRRRQVAALLDALRSTGQIADTGGAGTVLGGDFNTIQGGTQEEAYRRARAWSTSLATEDRRSTHRLGRLDYLFARLSPEWTIHTTRVENTYGSDHHPVLARFQRVPPRP